MKKSKLRLVFFRIIAVIIAVAIAYLGVTFNAFISSASHKKYTVECEYTEFGHLPIDLQDASDPSGFSSAMIDAQGYRKVAENQILCLFTNDRQGIKVYDKRNQFVWSGIVDDIQTISSPVEGDLADRMQSMICFSYVDRDSGWDMEKDTNSFKEEHTLVSEIIKSGIRFNYNFHKINIKISVDIVLNGDSVLATVPDDLIKEIEVGAESTSVLVKDLHNKIDIVNGYCNDIVSYADSNADIGDSMKNLISLNMNGVIESIIYVRGQVGSGTFSFERLTNSKDNIDVLSSLIFEQPVLDKLEKIKTGLDEIALFGQKLLDNCAMGLTKLEILPYFGYQTSKTDGYAFYPDDNGAISYFNVKHPDSSGVYDQDIYDVYLQKIPISGAQTADDTHVQPALMPVYGVKAFQGAFLAIITGGEFDSSIKFNPTTIKMDCANIYQSFYTRKRTSYIDHTGIQRKIFNSERNENNWQVTYKILTGNDANYSGMARTYRDHLEKTDRIKRSDALDRPMPVGLEFFMGLQSAQNSILPPYIVMTQYDYIESFVKKLEQNGIENVLLSIAGWTQKNGVKMPDKLMPSSQTGGKKALKSLTSYFHEKKYTMTLSTDYILANSGDLSKNAIDIIAVKSGAMIPAEINDRYFINPHYIYNKCTQNDFDEIKKLGVGGIGFNDLSKNLYFDFNVNASAERETMAGLFNELVLKADKKFDAVAVKTPVAYMLNGSDWLMHMPDSGSGYIFTDESVPFFQMVTHGLIPYTDSGYNYRYDEKKQALTSVEYGYIPYYFLTQNEPYEIFKEGYEDFYTTVADDWFDHIVESYSDFKNNFSRIWNVKMQAHERLDRDVNKVTYENGVSVYVNYSETVKTLDGVTISPLSYYVSE